MQEAQFNNRRTTTMTAHEKTTIAYRPNREANEQVIRMLCEQYPKCFFEENRQRRPLKQDITADIIKDNSLEVSPELITAAVDWYKSNIGYEGFAMSIPGAKRINLDGEAVGTVTEQEAIAAQQRIDDFHKDKNERTAALGPVKVLNQMHDRGQISDCGVKKLDAPQPPTITKTKATAIAPEFAALYEILNAANVSVIGSDPTMRAIVAKMLLNKVIKKFQQVESEMEE
jgi:sRNA-binding protein